MQILKTGPWSADEEALLLELLPRHTYKELAEKLGRTFDSVKARAIKKLKVHKNGCWRSLDSHFDRNIDKSGDCWIWTGSKDKAGYGVLRGRKNGGTWFAHRYSMYRHNGRLERHKYVLHRCDVKSCVNPSHLYVGTLSDNAQDMIRRSNHSWYRLNPDMANTVRFMCQTGLSHKQVAAIIGVSKTTVSRVVHRRSWDT